MFSFVRIDELLTHLTVWAKLVLLGHYLMCFFHWTLWEWSML